MSSCLSATSFLRASCVSLAMLGLSSSGARAVEFTAAKTVAIAGDGFVGDLAAMNDLEPLAEIAALQRDRLPALSTFGQAASAQADTQLRSSVPSSARAHSLFGGQVFANSSAAIPLLIGDLEPVASPVSRPLAGGRLVGARPSLPLNRAPLTRLPSATVTRTAR